MFEAIGVPVAILGIIFVGGCLLTEIKDSMRKPKIPKGTTFYDKSWMI